MKSNTLITKETPKENHSKFSLVNTQSLSQNYYEKIITYDLLLKQNYTSIMQLSRIKKIILNTSSKTYTVDKKYILFTLAALELVSGQKPKLTYARKSIANFKLRQQQIIGCKVDLSDEKMYLFLDKLSHIILPRIRDSLNKKTLPQNQEITQNAKKIKLKTNGISKNVSTFHFSFQNMMIFPELENHYDLVDNFRGMNLTFVLSKSTQTRGSLLLTSFQLPFFLALFFF